MQIWHYAPSTGELVGVGIADPDPLRQGHWLIPAFATTVEPPNTLQGEAAVFSNGVWSIVEDHRGEVYYTEEGEQVTITELGPVPGGLLTEAPPPPPPPPAPPPVASPRQIRLALNQLGLRETIETYIAAADQTTKDSWEYTTLFERDHPLILACAQALNKTEAEIDALFDLAITL